jgi:hypothetical protein
VASGILKRLEQFAQLSVASLGRSKPRENAQIYIYGLLSDLEKENIESITYGFDQDRRAL